MTPEERAAAVAEAASLEPEAPLEEQVRALEKALSQLETLFTEAQEQ
ncbi:MAG: hypothetical protein FWD29_04285 [Micrococcales bacterium]|nr:hypothetical protein [Micrococcales bacterium]